KKSFLFLCAVALWCILIRQAVFPSMPCVKEPEVDLIIDRETQVKMPSKKSFKEGDVYMSSHEQRFRLFSSVEYEGQLYMTPQNFIESVTMSEPRSMYY
uniref:Uncharacterized protein n=1 Tax=Hucho hucho TaxID=62062 RepID=A0A4W5K6L3_9TELE